MSAGVVATPTYQGVTKLPTAAHLRTNLLNGNVRVSSQTNTVGGQPAVYEITGGSITSNVKLALPNVTGDDTLVTQNGNIVWGGGHTFQQGLNANGPLITTSSISGQSISANNMTVTAAFNSGGSITSGDSLNAKNNLIVGGTGSIGSDHSVGGNSSVTGNHTVGGALNAVLTGGIYNLTIGTAATTHQGQVVQHFPHGLSYSAGANAHLLLQNQNGGADADWFGVFTGTTHGTFICTDNASQKLAFHGASATVAAIASHGSISTGGTYGTNADHMLTDCYTCLRSNGLLT